MNHVISDYFCAFSPRFSHILCACSTAGAAIKAGGSEFELEFRRREAELGVRTAQREEKLRDGELHLQERVQRVAVINMELSSEDHT